MERRTVGVLDIKVTGATKDVPTVVSDSRVVGSYFASYGWKELIIDLPLDDDFSAFEKIQEFQLLVAANISLRGAEPILDAAQKLSLPVYSFLERKELPREGTFELHEGNGPYGIHIVHYKHLNGQGLSQATNIIMREHFSSEAENYRRRIGQ